MHLSIQARTRPGQATLFMVEFRIESEPEDCANRRRTWWGLWVGWWLYRPRYWREWLWSWTWESEDSFVRRWHHFAVRLLGFEVVWQFAGAERDDE